MKFVIWCYVVFFGMHTAAFAQDDRVGNYIGVGLGVYSAALKNELVSNIRHSGFQVPSFQLSYIRERTFNVHSLNITYSNTTLYSKFEQNYTTDFRPQLQYTWHTKLSRSNGPLSLFGGVSAVAYFSDRDVSFDNKNIANNYNQEIALLLSVSCAGQYQTGRNIFNAQLSYGFSSLSQRTGYANRVRQESDWLIQSFGTFRHHSVIIGYARELSLKFNIRLEYTMQFHRFDEPEYLGYLSNRLFVIGYIRL